MKNLTVFGLISIILLLGFSGCVDNTNKGAPIENPPQSKICEFPYGNGTIVSVDYIGKFENGTIFDTSIEQVAKEANIYNPQRNYKPIEFTIGKGQMIKGFENAVLNMSEGEEKTIILPPNEAYGEINKSYIVPYPIEIFNNTNITPKKGMRLYIRGAPVKIAEVNETTVLLDFNHPMAGKTLVFDIKLINITIPQK
ncbi:FKBP-type peptidyl-prolyl cis-trans isomerase [Methanococcus aeolicus]|uniref:Peptidyl-prolyl cis-trans isomerase n=1 Tax=Methanococcus aeolicus (strain ATCC BAA-1280 / DSM 17508 / OCM 812 / Nankai-3) TaxID=419665 RepID=A6UWN2_META3|nr:peptidylprolyl isomerase [Methanococcus aeolicus]ABR56904.1 peptidylprolyl isomerase FKBP-type [Methanococcus aeolicus Nankai-3]UXM84902.1 peptidylprolyl isomerase [Methanococcus aeolicus]